MKHCVCATLCVLVFSLAAFAQTPATPACSFQALDVPNGFVSAGLGINDVGAVVGALTPGPRSLDRAYLLYAGKYTTFMFPGSIGSDANDINNHAQIVGSYSDPAGRQHGFVVQSGGFQTIDFPGAPNGTIASGINSSGDIVGFYFDAANQSRAFLLHAGHFTPFTFPGSQTTQATGINDNSVIVGTYSNGVGSANHGFMVKNGAFAAVDFPGAADTFAYKVNNAGVIVGSYSAADRTAHGFVLANGKFITIDDPGTTSTSILGINNFHQIVGAFSTPTSFNSLAFQANCQNVF